MKCRQRRRGSWPRSRNAASRLSTWGGGGLAEISVSSLQLRWWRGSLTSTSPRVATSGQQASVLTQQLGLQTGDSIYDQGEHRCPGEPAQATPPPHGRGESAGVAVPLSTDPGSRQRRSSAQDGELCHLPASGRQAARHQFLAGTRSRGSAARQFSPRATHEVFSADRPQESPRSISTPQHGSEPLTGARQYGSTRFNRPPARCRSPRPALRWRGIEQRAWPAEGHYRAAG